MSVVTTSTEHRIGYGFGTYETLEPSQYIIAFEMESGDWDMIESFEAKNDEEANAYAEANYGEQEWYVLDSAGDNINA